ncbi:helix-turn-helix domain-containing protein [Cellulomonas fimi]|uniref:Helix-turn-helix domain protein n=1 Tax=Cellulomonas fimi (strain ATCC 484 / DSM 20113 / JCM 1341 / CCUG 24087 / LMG 16345 / NBRC 15513 / NCIMB 8980 / NCTC 7547 / NRS-133) TaxID=590998 RepID=F4H3X8_CELFA|nr:helix-turn-helix transcriptional regulator [Cellulomonas fimi]AEE44202.1 helix-turn-helix domain protein [Cellulomonas fimi ATCC 484]VEH25874.1 anaerobic benzoate catabolism transcriptional regulator [Cellulomonas fimi]
MTQDLAGPVTTQHTLEHRTEPLLRRLVGAVLRERREDQGRTLRDVALDARVSVAYLSEIERGRKEASSEVLVAVCRALGMRLVDLVGAAHAELARLDGRVVVDLTAPPRRPDVELPDDVARGPQVRGRTGRGPADGTGSDRALVVVDLVATDHELAVPPATLTPRPTGPTGLLLAA